jgi:WD domain, G-beta repeat
VNRLTRWWLTAPCLLASLSLATAEDLKPALLEGGLLPMGSPREGPGASMASVAFSPDGKTVAGACYDQLIRLWDAQSGREIRRLQDHRDWVSSVVFGPDGTLLASGSRDWTVRVWEARSGNELRRLQGHQGAVLPVAFAPHGDVLASGSQDKTIVLWDPATGARRRTLRGHEDWVTSLAFTRDGKRLASGGWDGTVRLWDVATGNELQRFGKGHGRIHAIALSPNGGTLAAATQNRFICRWQIAGGREIASFPVERHRAISLVYAPDGSRLASAGKDGVIRLWDAATGNEACPIGDPYYRALCLTFSPDGTSLASGGASGLTILWDVAGRAFRPEALPAKLAAADLERLWSDLAGDDPARAQQAMWTLARAPRQTVPWIREHVPPVRIDAARVDRLIRDLDDARFTVRQQATVELASIGKFAEQAMERALKSKPTLETRQRLEELLNRLDRGRVVAYADAGRAQRTFRVLEQIDTPDARQALHRLAGGAPESWLTQEAGRTLARMHTRSPAR